MRILFLITIYFIFGSIFNSLQATPIIVGETLTVNSKVLNEARSILVYKPLDYQKDKKYHVIYLLDGSDHFYTTLGAVNGLVSNRQIPESIIVGIVTTNRPRDFIPNITSDVKSPKQKWMSNEFPEIGGADNFIEFIETELIPYIDKRYSTYPHRTIIGHSNGGIFALHTLFNKPRLFNNYLVISPADWWNKTELKENVKNLAGLNQLSAKLYLTIGNEGNNFFASVLDLVSSLELNKSDNISWQYKQFEEENHGTVIQPSIIVGLKSLFKDLQFSSLDFVAQHADLSVIDDYYQKLSFTYGYSVKIPMNVYSALADKQVSFGRSTQALITLETFVRMYPDAPFAHMSLGNIYMEQTQYSKAKKSFELALNLYEEEGVDGVAGYLKDMIELAESKS